ncbi:MAG: hypothetical protein ACTIK4_13415 [Mesonia sp.]|uniref:hypothetical protein n=1 Tax=Mesonia sp. TaxID=1960830 RepID=UPI003F9ADD06
MRINYSKYYPWKEKADFENKIISGQKIHTVRRTNWGAKPGAVLSHGEKIGGWGYKRREFLINKCTDVQDVELIFNGRKVIAAKVDGSKADWKLIAKNDGLTEEQFSKWFYNYAEKGIFRGFIIHWTDLKY